MKALPGWAVQQLHDQLTEAARRKRVSAERSADDKWSHHLAPGLHQEADGLDEALAILLDILADA